MLSFVQTPNLRIRVFVAVFALACIASLAFVFARPAVYAGSARLQVEMLPGSSQSGDGDNTAPNLLVAAQALTSNVVLDEVARQLGGSPSLNADALRGMLSAAPVEGTNVIDLHGEGGDRELLLRALRAWTEAWRRTETDAHAQSSTATLEDARTSVEQLKRDVAAKRQELEQFRKKFDIVSGERDENQSAARLRALNSAINEARNREVKAEAALNAMRENMAAGKPVAGAAERAVVADLERRASDLRDRMKDLEQEFTPHYLSFDPKYKAMKANLTRLEQQIEQERRGSAAQAVQAAEDELASSRQAQLRLQQEFTVRKRETQEFSTRFSEQTALVNELKRLEESYDGEKARLAALDAGRKRAGPKMTVLAVPSVPERPIRPDYWRDALIGIAGSCALGFAAVWFVEFFKRSGVPRLEPATQPIIHISYPPGITLDRAVPVLASDAPRLIERIPQFPRELSGPEVYALWNAAGPDARVVVAGLLGGLSLEDLTALRHEDVDFDANSMRIPSVSGRSGALRDPLRRLLIERRPATGSGAALSDRQGKPLSNADLEGLVACAACDAGLSNPVEVTSEALRHTYFAYLIRQGARLADIGEFIGHISPAAFRDYGRLSPAGPGLPLEQIDPVFPALRVQG
ncbi:MAG TPA: hypothetical protein VKF40_23700 [Burkholderiales bacterium]|nr:hypothetical protein [Burkholderiales bacterium]